MAKKSPKMPPKGMHEMKGGMMMPNASMPWMAGKLGKPTSKKKTSKKRTRGGKK